MAVLGNFVDRVGTALRLPEMGYSERLNKGKPTVNTGNTYASQQAGYRNYSPQIASYGGVQKLPNTYSSGGQVLGANTGGGGTPTQGAPANSFNLDQNIPSPDQGSPDGGPSELDMINDEFNNFQSFLGNQETQANQNFTNTQNAITGERDLAVTDAEKQRGFREQEIDAKSAQGRESERLNLRKVRQLLQDLEQRNAARLAISGGGSTSDALAERFGRTAQEQTGSVLSEGQRYQNDLAIEGEKVDQFYDNSISKIKLNAQTQIDQARQNLQANLSEIDNQRRASAAEKARARYQTWRDYYSNVNQAKLQAASFQMQYDLWKQQKDGELAGAASYQVGNVTPFNTSAGLFDTRSSVPNITTNTPATNTQAMVSATRRGANEEEEQGLFA